MTANVKKFAFCQCYLNRNIFIQSLGLHLAYDNDQQFQDQYKGLISSQDLPETLQKVKKEIQRRRQFRENVQQRIDLVKNSYIPLHPEVYKFQKDFLATDLDYEKVGSEVFKVPVFTEEFVGKFMSELKHFQNSNISYARPTTMHKYGFLLDEIGFKDFFDGFRTSFLQPLSRKLFQDETIELDSQKVFIVKYAMNEDTEKAAHFDNAEITLNVALSDDDSYAGGELVFKPSKGPLFGYEHEFCHAILHKGSLIHEALPITSGERWNLIIWARSSKSRNDKCPMCASTPILSEAPDGTYGDGFILEPSKTTSQVANFPSILTCFLAVSVFFFIQQLFE